jgi:hypothetical protein
MADNFDWLIKARASNQEVLLRLYRFSRFVIALTVERKPFLVFRFWSAQHSPYGVRRL